MTKTRTMTVTDYVNLNVEADLKRYQSDLSFDAVTGRTRMSGRAVARLCQVNSATPTKILTAVLKSSEGAAFAHPKIVEALATSGFEGAAFVDATRSKGWDAEAAAILLSYYATTYHTSKPIAVTNLKYLTGGSLEMVNLSLLGIAIEESEPVTVTQVPTTEPGQLTGIQQIEEAYAHIKALRDLGVNI